MVVAIPGKSDYRKLEIHLEGNGVNRALSDRPLSTNGQPQSERRAVALETPEILTEPTRS
jgi:hypothetical protein